MSPGWILAMGAMAVAQSTRYEPNWEPKTVEELYFAYRWHGLPLPPTDAVLIRWVEQVYLRSSEGVVRENDHRLGLMVRKLSDFKPAIVWCDGYVYEEFRVSRLQPALPLVKYLDREHWFAEDLVRLAAQAYHLGWTELAQAAFERAKTTARGGAYSPTAEDRDHILLTLRTMTWDESYRSLTETGTDRKKLYGALKLVADNDARFRDKYQTELLRGIRLTLRPSIAKPGSVAALIDGLTECDRNGIWGLEHLGPPNAFDKLLERGFETVPDLMAHLDDGRVTRASDLRGANNGTWFHVGRVGELCSSLLNGLAADTLPNRHDVTPAQFRKAVSEWYEVAKKTGEERWALDHILSGEGRVNRYLLRLIRAKYPHHLPQLYKSVLRREQNLHTDAVAVEVAASALDRETKLDLLRAGANSRQGAHRLPAVVALEHVDRAEYRKAVKATLKWISSTKLDAKDWEFQFNSYQLVDLVRRAGDTECWSELRLTCQAAPPPARMRLIDRVSDFNQARDPDNLKQSLKLLMELLPDRTVRDSNEINGFPHPGHAYPMLAVGDFAALRLAEYLDYEVPWDQKRTASEWATIREAVRVEVERKLAQGK